MVTRDSADCASFWQWQMTRKVNRNLQLLDSSLKMVTVAIQLPFIYMLCIAYMFHRIAVFLGDSGFPDILAKSYKIVLSHTDTEDLYQQQAEVELGNGHLIQDIATRCNLLLVMIFCILKNKEAVRPHWPNSTRLGLLTTSWRNKVQRLETILQQYRQKQ